MSTFQDNIIILDRVAIIKEKFYDILTIVKITVFSSAILQRHSLRVDKAEWR